MAAPDLMGAQIFETSSFRESLGKVLLGKYPAIVVKPLY